MEATEVCKQEDRCIRSSQCAFREAWSACCSPETKISGLVCGEQLLLSLTCQLSINNVWCQYYQKVGFYITMICDIDTSSNGTLEAATATII
ncbi:hypothetical protein PoB_000875000 [Plakobranchus ocellatus]|uniref:Uncharacterized protein n=1 Tax=Plakobranchus ocellatus TaxID=259542 RepID=A0AAV3YHN5_9GAST|nr:hypothetical protein PoB_000875000 [Plakobranchus ocellatus]